MFGYPIDVLIVRKRDIEANTLRSSGFGVGVSSEGLFPPSAFVLLILRLGCRRIFRASPTFAFWDLDFWSPLFDVEETLAVEFDVDFIVAVEVNGERRVLYHGLEFIIWPVGYCSRFLTQRAADLLVQSQSTHQCPLGCLVISFLASLAAMP